MMCAIWQAIWDAAVYHASKGEYEGTEDILRPLYGIEDLHRAYKEICDTPTFLGKRCVLLEPSSLAGQAPRVKTHVCTLSLPQ